jgi:transcriptional regulator with XRE-family HTH domain
MDKKKFGKILRELRESKFAGYGGRKKFADSIGLSSNIISHYEAGRREPSEERMKQFADFFGVTVSHLRGEDTEGECHSPEFLSGEITEAEEAERKEAVATRLEWLRQSFGDGNHRKAENALGVPRGKWKKWESGDLWLDRPTAHTLGQIIGVDERWFYDASIPTPEITLDGSGVAIRLTGEIGENFTGYFVTALGFPELWLPRDAQWWLVKDDSLLPVAPKWSFLVLEVGSEAIDGDLIAAFREARGNTFKGVVGYLRSVGESMVVVPIRHDSQLVPIQKNDIMGVVVGVYTDFEVVRKRSESS